MSPDPVDRLLSEATCLRPSEEDPVLTSLRRALLLEDALGLTLTDAQILAGNLADPQAVRALLDDRTPAD